MGKRNKKTDYNQLPFDREAPDWLKARDFDAQYNQNRTYTNTPQSDAAGIEKPKGRHRK